MAMNWAKACVAVVATLVFTGSVLADPAALKELAPTGKLRVGIAVAPSPGAGNVALDASGEPRGVGGDLGRDLAKKLGVPVQWVPYPNSGALTDGLAAGACDVAFLPVDNERRKKVDFGPPHIVLQSTFLVPAGSAIQSLAEADKPGLARGRRREHGNDARRSGIFEERHDEQREGRGSARRLVQNRPGRRHRLVAGVARPACSEVPRLARAAGRLHELVRGSRRAQGQTGSAGVCQRFR